MSADPAVAVSEVRVLDGPNLYFPRPAVKTTLALPGYLVAPEADLLALAARIGMGARRPGPPGTEQRQRFTMRLVERAVRQLARRSGTTRLGIRTRPGAAVDVVVVAFVWRRRGRAQALAGALQPTLTAWLEGGDVLTEQAEGVGRTAPGDRPSALVPGVPVASVTGTNGKTTTTRLLGHIGMVAGLRTAWSSTDGIVVQGEVVEPGDYSGPAGARAVLTTPGVELAVLETARGGLLLRGMGVSANDVSVVTNVSADHLGMQGIDTLDQLAEVKSIVTRVTRAEGWAVLNGEDPRVWGMRRVTRARPWAFALDPAAPALREALDSGGRAMTILDDDLTVLESGRDPDRLVSVLDVPATLAGLSRHNTANALAAAAAALGLGLPRGAVVAGLRTFAPDTEHNPGRMNTYTLPLAAGSATVVVDMAHNEDSLEALMDVAEGLLAPGASTRLGLGLAGDRTDELLRSMGEIAGRRAGHVVIVHKEHYLRGRTTAGLEGHLRAGLADVGVAEAESFPTELEGLQALVTAAHDGDVVALMCHEDRDAVTAWLAARGATADAPADIRRKVVLARGEHELEPEIARSWALVDGEERVRAMAALHAARPGDPRLAFEHAGALDAAGREREAVPLYQHALDTGLREPHRHQALLQLASSLRVEGRPEEARELLAPLAAERPDSAAVAAFLALADLDAGREREAVAVLVEVLLRHAGDPDTQRYQAALRRYAAALRG